MRPLKNFQSAAIEDAVNTFKQTADLIGQARSSVEKNAIINTNGALLIEAPTGAGKTLIAGHIAEGMSLTVKTVWLWVAPFSGLVDQTSSVLMDEFSNLRVRNLSIDRNLSATRSGDVFLTTWAAVATDKKESRKIRKDGEQLPSVDHLLISLKSENYFIGAIIDEAHHGFSKAKQALGFYRSVFTPDFTILITATPKDNDIDIFKAATGIKNLHRIGISRRDCVDAGLIKKGIRAVAFKADDNQESLLDFEMTALRHGTEVHREIVKILRSVGVELTPLMLVQVDSDANSVETARKKLLDLGFLESEIAVHTADEPDPDLVGMVNDEKKQVLIFKLAVAMGFDAPRAFTLVSMRRIRDESFGIQIVGRILRVDRRLQGIDLLEPLNYGYVFLADYNSQAGLSLAADRISAIRTELTSESPNMALLTVGPSGQIVRDMGNGENCLIGADTDFFDKKSKESVLTAPFIAIESSSHNSVILNAIMPEFRLLRTELGEKNYPLTAPSERIQLNPTYSYPLRTDISFPVVFKREIYPCEFKRITENIVNKARITSDILAMSRRKSAHIIKKEIDLFDHRRESVSDSFANLSEKAITIKAQQNLFASESDYINSAELYKLMLARLRKEYIKVGWTDMTEDHSLKQGLDLILAAYPSLLKNAIRESMADHSIAIDTEPLPAKIISDTRLESSRLNLYCVIPDSLNRWEREFAEKLDNDTTGTVLWWHRNEDRKPWSVSMVVPGFYDFYPDFVLGIKNRIIGPEILLIEVKGEINNAKGDSAAKARAEHKTYGRVMMVYWEDEKRWYTIRYDQSSDKNKLDRLFDFYLLEGF